MLPSPVNSSWLRLADGAVNSRGGFGFSDVCAVYQAPLFCFSSSTLGLFLYKIEKLINAFYKAASDDQ